MVIIWKIYVSFTSSFKYTIQYQQGLDYQIHPVYFCLLAGWLFSPTLSQTCKTFCGITRYWCSDCDFLQMVLFLVFPLSFTPSLSPFVCPPQVPACFTHCLLQYSSWRLTCLSRSGWRPGGCAPSPPLLTPLSAPPSPASPPAPYHPLWAQVFR